MNAETADLYDRHIEQGIALRHRREFAAAIQEFDAACRLRPHAHGARCELAFTYLQAGKLDDAHAAYLAVWQADQANVDALAGLARICHERGELPAALTYLQQATSIAPERLAPWIHMAGVLRDLSRYEEARSVLNDVLTRDPNNSNALIGLALLARQGGDHGASVSLFRQALHDQPNHVGLQLELALSLRHAGLDAAATTLYRSILDRDGSNADAVAGLALVLRKQGDPTTALQYLRGGVEKVPENSKLRLELAAALRELSLLDEAEREYAAVHDALPDSWAALVGLGLIARQRDDHALALKFFTAALALHPDHMGLQSELALTLRLLERLDEAERLYRRAAEAAPRAAGPLKGLSLIAVARGERDSAIELAKLACSVEPGNVDHLLLLAALYRDAGCTTEASALVDDSLIADPNNVGAWIEKGYLLRLSNDRAGALAAFERAATSDPQRGLIETAAEHLALGHPEQARSAYQKILAVAPMHFAALLGMAELEMLAANYQKCIEICDSLIAGYPKRVAPYRRKCRALIQLDRADEAVRIAAELETFSLNRADADAARLEILRTCGRRKEAEDLLRLPRVAMTRVFELWLEGVLARLAFYDLDGAEAALRDPPALRAYERSRVLYAKGLLADLQWRVDEAASAFEEALAIHTDDPGAHHHLARLCFLRADAEGSMRHLQAMTRLSSSTLSLRGESHNASQNLIGQLLNELSLDSDLLSRLTAVRTEGSQRQIEMLSEIVRSEGRLTPPAIYLMLALRQSGDFEIAPATSGGALTWPIPRNIVQYWDQTRPPDGITELLRTWVESHPGYHYCRFDNTAARDYLAAHYPQAVLNAYRSAAHPAQKSDLFRLAYLFREGGWYIDADDRCVGNLSEITAPDAVFIAYQEQYATLGNNFLGCIPEEPVIGRALTLAVETLNRGGSDAIWLATGPGLLTRAFSDVLVRQGSAWQDWLRERRILDRKDLAKVAWPHSISLYKGTRRGWLHSVFKTRLRGIAHT